MEKEEAVTNRWKIPGFTFKNECTPEALAAAIAWLEADLRLSQVATKNGEETKNDSKVCFSTFLDDGKQGMHTFNSACHAYLDQQDRNTGTRSCVAFWCDPLGFEEYHAYHDWLRKDSFASEYILYSSRRGIVVSADIPAGVMHAIAMMSRMPRQLGKNSCTWFKELLDAGIPGEVAYHCCFNIAVGPKTMPFRGALDHRAWHCPDVAGMKDFLEGAPTSVSLGTYRHTSTQICSCFFPSSGADTFVTELFERKDFLEELSALRKAKAFGQKYVPPNPFYNTAGIPTLRANQCTIEEVHSFVLPYCMREGVFNAEEI